MNSSITKSDRNLATLIHLSVFSKYFIPFGNFIFPLIIWLSKKEDKFLDHHGRNAINFQISLFLYFILLILLGVAFVVLLAARLGLNDSFVINNHDFPFREFSQALPFVILAGVIGILLLGLFILELFAVISASIKSSEGQLYNYPLTINFISPDKNGNHQSHHQSKNEQSNNFQNQTL